LNIVWLVWRKPFFPYTMRQETYSAEKKVSFQSDQIQFIPAGMRESVDVVPYA
jgi:hypothetical protein